MNEMQIVTGMWSIEDLNRAIAMPEKIFLDDDRVMRPITQWKPCIEGPDKIVTLSVEGFVEDDRIYLPTERPYTKDGRKFGITFWMPHIEKFYGTVLSFRAEVWMNKT